MRKLCIIFIVFAMVGSATAIVVPDASFEGLASSGWWAYVNDVTSPWDCSTDGGGSSWIGDNYVQSYGYPQVGHDGLAYVGMNGKYIYQTLPDTYLEGVTYRLSVWATTGQDDSGQRVYIYFQDDVGDIAASGALDIPMSSGGTHDWYPYSLNYTATAADTGKNITIMFWGDGEAYIDDVTLDALGSIPAVMITESLDSTEVDEDGATDSYDIVLNSSPTHDVQVTVTPADSQIDIGSGPGVAKVLTFTPEAGGDWDSPQTITVTAYDDTVFEPDDDPHTTVITQICQSTDSDYDDIPVKSVSVAVYDNDLGCGSWGYLDSDINHDCYVNLLDLKMLAEKWLFLQP